MSSCQLSFDFQDSAGVCRNGLQGSHKKASEAFVPRQLSNNTSTLCMGSCEERRQVATTTSATCGAWASLPTCGAPRNSRIALPGPAIVVAACSRHARLLSGEPPFYDGHCDDWTMQKILNEPLDVYGRLSSSGIVTDPARGKFVFPTLRPLIRGFCSTVGNRERRCV